MKCFWQCKCCGEQLKDTVDSCWSCGANKDGSPPENPSEFEAAKTDTRETIVGAAQQSRTVGIVLAFIGVLLIVFGAMRWSSAESQIRRAFGQTDVVAIFLFIGGAVALLIGFSRSLTSSPSTSDSPPLSNNSVEERLRRLNDLRAKQLLSDAEYEQRRKDIIASL